MVKGKTDRLLILDTETTGLDPKDSATIEVACTLFDIDANAAVDTFSALVFSTTNAAEAINRIPVSLLQQGRSSTDVWPHVMALAKSADAIVAHRAEFDRGFVPSDLRTLRPWICSKFEIEWPRGEAGAHLVHLALAHGVPVFSAHRALADVDTLVRTFQAAAAMTDVRAMLARAMRPRVLVQAMVGYDDREKAKTAGFAWDGASKRWTKRVAVEDVGALPFPTREVTE